MLTGIDFSIDDVNISSNVLSFYIFKYQENFFCHQSVDELAQYFVILISIHTLYISAIQSKYFVKNNERLSNN